jgi:Peptidase family M28
MRAPETVAELARFSGRGAGSDAERRAARWLAQQLEAGGRRTRIEPFWCRPNWALAHAWHAGLGLVGSLVAVGSPRVGGVLVLIALISVVADELAGFSLGRRLTPERASQNVIAAPRRDPGPEAVRLIITANYDAGRTGLVYRRGIRRTAARLQQATQGIGPGWLGWLSIALVWLLVVAVLRLEGQTGDLVGALQFVPTVALVLALALLLEIATSGFSPAAADNGSGTAVAMAMAGALDAGAPGRLAVELVLQGAGDTQAIGLRRYLHARRKTQRAANTVVLGLAPCGTGMLRWFSSDGRLVPMRYFARLQALCRQIEDPAARPHRGRGTTPALPARAARLPAISIGCLDQRGLVEHSHTTSDLPAALDADAVDATLQFGLVLVDAIDAYVAEHVRSPAPQPPERQRVTQA